MTVPRRTAVGEQPQYSKLEPLTFQDLCKEILQASPDYRNVQVYGRPGQMQRGIDILAERLSPSGLTVGQCKRFQILMDSQVSGAVKEFFKHREYWKRQGVDTFILFVSCDASDTKVQSEFLRQRRRLQRSGFAFELWSDSTITKHLRSNAGIISTYLGGDWPTILCGGSAYVSQSGLPNITNLLFTQLEQVAALHSDAVERNIEGAREAWRSGNKKDALNVVEDYRQTHVWQTLQPQTRSSLCRLEAQLVLDDGQLEQAKKLLDEANSYASGKALRLEALILRAENQREKARALLEDSSEIENVTLSAALSLEMGEIDRALQRLDGVNNSSDSHRLRALAYLMSGNPDNASEEIGKAILLAPTWTINRFTSGIIDYYFSLSPNHRLEKLPPWPEPPHWSVVRTDDETRTRLSRAAGVFRSLQNEPSSQFQFVRVLKTWELACVANDSIRRSDANVLCDQILSDDPANEYCLVWAVARRLDVDTLQPRALLEQKARTPGGAYESVISLLICYLEEQDIDSAMQLIRDSRENFERIDQIQVWQFWHDQITAIRGGEDGEVRDPASNEKQFLRLSLRSKARATGDLQPLAQFLERRQAEGDVEATLELCDLYAASGRWSNAMPLAAKLLETVQTTEALRLACTIFFNAGLCSKCAESIEKHRSRFPLSKLPVSLVQMKAAAEQRSGEIRSAVRSAEDALSLDANRINLRNLAELYLESGDFTALAQLASRHERFPDLTTEDLLVLAARLSSVNQAVGVSLWKRAVELGVTDEQIGGAISIAYSLSLDAEVGPLMLRLTSLPEGAGFQRFDLSQVQTILQSRYEAANATYERYRAGEVCLQAAIGVFGGQLSHWYSRRLTDNESDQKTQYPIYVRHGWRSRSEPFDGVPRRLCADLTSLLLARRLGVLRHIVKAYRPLYVPHGTPLTLAAMREATLPHQPVRKTNLLVVQGAISSGLITLLPSKDSPPESTEGPEGHFKASELIAIDFATPSGDGIKDKSCSPHSVIRLAAECGRLSSDRSGIALASLGPEQENGDRGALGTTSRMLVSASVLEAFARAGILHEVCEAFDVYIKEEESNALSQETKGFQRAEEDAAWLTSMIEEIRVGIEAGDYRLLPLIDIRRRDAKNGEEPLPFHCMLDLLKYENQNTDLIWIDDRTMNGFIHRDGSKIVDTVDLLLHLRSSGELSDDDFYRCLHRYRASGLRFLALRKDELLYWLNAAAEPNGQFKESYELFILRLSHARAVADSDALRTAPVKEGQTLEWPFLLDSSGAVLDALQELWYLKGQDSACERKAQWLLSHLYMPDRGRSSALGNMTPESDLMMEAMALGALIASTCAGFGLDEHGRGARRKYLDWLYHRLLLPRFETDAELRELTLNQVTQMLRVLLPQRRETRKQAAGMAQIIKLWLEDLPGEIRDRVAADNGLMDSFGVTLIRSVVIGDMHFDATKFWSAAREVLRSGAPVSLGLGRLFSQFKDGVSLLATENVRTGEKSLLEGVPLEILASSASQRENALLHVTKVFDLSQRDADNLRQTLRDESSPAEVMQRLVLLRARSARHFYGGLEEKLRRDKEVALSDLIPSDTGLFLRHLRLDAENAEAERTEGERDILGTLATSVPLEDALDRLAQLPRTFPRELLDRLTVLSVQERREVLKKFAKRSAWNIVPMSHACHLFYAFEADNPAYVRFADRLLRMILSAEGTSPVDALLRVLEHVESELRLNSDFARLPIAIRLLSLWSHSSNLLRTMAHVGVDLNWIGSKFGQGWNRLPTEIFNEESEYWRDVAHPSRLSPSRFVLALTWFASQNGAHLPQEMRQEISDIWKTDGSRVIDLLFDASREPDAMGSFFAENTGWPAAFVGESFAYYSSSRNPSGAVETAKLLHQGGDVIHWAHLQAVFRNGTVPDDAKEAFRELLLSADFEQLRSARPELVRVALTFASMHAHALGPDVVGKIRTDILKMAKTEFRGTESRHEQRIEDTLLSAGFYLYRRSVPQERQFEQTAMFWRELVESNPTLAGGCQRMVDRFVEALPNRHSRHLWKLQVYLRSRDVVPEEWEKSIERTESDQPAVEEG